MNTSDECICGCHNPPEGVTRMHCVACCRQCPSCQKNIAICRYNDHEQKCVLSIELNYFDEHREEWFEHHAGKIALVKGTTVHDFCGNYENALQAGYDQYGLEPFLLKEVQLVDEVILCQGVGMSTRLSKRQMSKLRGKVCISCGDPADNLNMGGPVICSYCDNDPETVKRISEEIVKGLKELDRKGELARAGKRVAKAINRLRKERKLGPDELNRRATI